MRQDSAAFAAANEAKTKEPKFVVAIVFDVASIYVTSHAGITSVPGVVLANMLQDTSAISQRIIPDQARSEIGSMSFKVVDVGGAFTTEVKNKLGAGKGLKGKTVRLYVGYGSMDFTQFQLFQTQVITAASADDGLYQVDCEDISRIQRAQIFDLAKTTLRLPVTATDTTIPVYTTTGFTKVLHNSSWSDAPSSTVRYFKLDDEVIRSTGETSDTFTGCTRGVLNTRAVAHDVDSGTAVDRRPKVEEYVYLELPAVKLIYALMTGVLYNDSANLPASWHLGIDPAFVRLADFTGIGADLWDPANDAASFPVRFEGLTKSDGKKFIEGELLQLLGCFAPIYSDGTQGIRRLTRVLADAAPSAVITDQHAVSWGPLQHSMARLHNYFQVDWNWNGTDFTRRSIFVDAASVAIHGKAPIMALKFKGLHGSRHTDAMISTRLGFMRDRFAGPPEEIDVDVLPSLSKYEVGDVIRLQLPNVRDYAGTGTLDRAFEIQNKQEKAQDGKVSWELFGSTAKASIDPASAATTALPDAYYTAAGVALSTVATIIGNVVQAGTWDLPGNDDLNNAGAIYYHNADLTIGSTATLRLTKNVQLRVKGFLTINGAIEGRGRGSAGVADVATFASQAPGVQGFVGSSRGRDGVDLTLPGGPPNRITMVRTRQAGVTQLVNGAFPFLDLKVSGNSLLGLPTNLQGPSGGPGGKVVDTSFGASTVRSQGGTGAAAGAGLAIICRGMAFGASGQILLSGNSPAATSSVNLTVNIDAYPGPGGAGGPGALFIGLDGGSLSIPDLTGKFVSASGTVPNNGTPLVQPDNHPALAETSFISPPWVLAGYPDAGVISALDFSNSAHRIQYIPEAQTATPDVPLKPSAPTNVQAAPGIGQNVVIWTAATDDTQWDDKVAEIYASITNNLPDAVYVGEIVGTRFIHRLINHETEWYWVRYRARISNTTVFSNFSPIGPTSTATATAERPDDYSSAVSAANLFYNGNAEFGDNRNFTGVNGDPGFTSDGPLVWNASGGYNGGPYFSFTGGPTARLFGDDHALVNLDHEHELIGAFRGGATSDNLTYIGYACLDADLNNIHYGRCWRYPVALYSTTLAANANLGAASIDVNLPANHWDTVSTIAIHFNVDNDDDGSDLPTPIAKYLFVNTVTKSNLGGGVWRYTFAQGTVPGNFTTGQRVNISVDGSTYVYAIAQNVNPTAAWQRIATRIRGVNAPTVPQGTFVENELTYQQFRRGTIYVKPILLHAQGAAAARTTHYDELQLYDIGPKGTAIPPDADNTVKQRLIPDAEFDNVDPTNYWQVAEITGAGTSTIGFSSTGGIFGGRALLHFGNNTVELRPLARTKFQPVGEPNAGVYLRMRRTASLAADLFMDVCAQRYDAAGNWGNNSGYTLTLNNTTLPVANTWYEFYVPRKFFAAGAATYPFETATLRIIGSGSATGDIEIDAFQAYVLGSDFVPPTATGAGFQGQVPAPGANATPGSAVLADDASFKQVSSFAIASSQLTGTLPDARVAQSNVTQHQAALAINSLQIQTDIATKTSSFSVTSAMAEEIEICDSASTITITVGSNCLGGPGVSMVAIRRNTGAVTFSASGVTIRTPRSSSVTVQHGKAVLTQIDSTNFELAGDI